MINKKVTGIGCFAKPATLSRVFKKMVRNYTLGKFENTSPRNGHDRLRGTDNTLLLQALITGKTGYFPSTDSESYGAVRNKKITGFFLTLKNQQLNLSIFAKGNRNHRARYTATLAGYTALRKKRLN